MADPCPHCDEPLTADGGFCKACGWDAELQAADYRGEGTELPDDDLDYQDFLRAEGLGGEVPKGKLLAVAVVIVLLVGLLLLGGLR